MGILSIKKIKSDISSKLQFFSTLFSNPKKLEWKLRPNLSLSFLEWEKILSLLKCLLLLQRLCSRRLKWFQIYRAYNLSWCYLKTNIPHNFGLSIIQILQSNSWSVTFLSHILLSGTIRNMYQDKNFIITVKENN